MLSRLKKILASSKGADYLEINYSEGSDSQLIAEKNQIKEINSSENTGIIVRAWLGKKLGVFSSNSFDSQAVEKAIELARISKPLDFFYGLPSRQKYPKIKGICQKMPSEKEMVLLAKKLISKIADKKKGVYVSRLIFDKSLGQQFLINSKGIETSEKTAMVGVEILAIAKKGGCVATHEDSFLERKLPNLDYFARSIKEEVVNLVKAKPLKEKPEIIILAPRVLAELFSNAFLDNFSAMNIIKKRSLFQNKLGKKIISPKINLIDNGLMEGGTLSGSFDSEGTATKKTILIKDGVLKNFIHSFNTAKHLKMAPTGNADGFNNLIIIPSKENLFKKISNKKVLLVKSIIGAHTANEITTAFSVKTFGAYLLKDGKKQPVKDLMLSGKFIEALNNVLAVDNKIENISGFYLPSIAFSGGIEITF